MRKFFTRQLFQSKLKTPSIDTLQPLVDDNYTIQCPHCIGTVQIPRGELNCQIFRHGTYKLTNAPINPHAPKAECDYLLAQDLIYGCGKPFWYDGKTVSLCDYI